MKRISIKDIAQKANVSITTVSFVINGKARERSISVKVIEKVEKIIDELGYKPNQIARSLRTGNSKVIGLIVEDISNQFFSSIARLIEDKAYKRGYKLSYSSTENDPKKAKDIINMFYNRNVDAYIISPMPGMSADILKIIDDGKPVVFFDRNLPDMQIPFVGVNHLQASFDATENLIKSGKKNIALVTVDLDVKQITDRLNGYKQALEANKITVKDELILKIPFGQQDQKTVKQIGALLNTSTIDAVLFTTNYLAIKGLFALKESTRLKDKSLSVIAYDDMEIFQLHTPPISAIEQPLEQIAENIITLILKLLNKPASTDVSDVIIPSRLILR